MSRLTFPKVQSSDNKQLQKLAGDVQDDPDNFEAWTTLVTAAELQDGRINRNSTPEAIEAYREVFDALLLKFPLFFGYWQKYAAIEFTIGGTEAADITFERAVAAFPNSVDLWKGYCEHRVKTCHDSPIVRELFERGASFVGREFNSHPFWDYYLSVEQRNHNMDHVCAIYLQLLETPLQKWQEYVKDYQNMAIHRPVHEICDKDVLAKIEKEVLDQVNGQDVANEAIDIEVRARITSHYEVVVQKTHQKITARWHFEQNLGRPYFHTAELEESALENWRAYLVFEEEHGDYESITLLYERCLVTAAYYEEFWLRYTRWKAGQNSDDVERGIRSTTEEVRHIYQRACTFFAAISQFEIRLQYARFEEAQKRVSVAYDIYEAILMVLPNHVETIVAWANCARRNDGIEAAAATFADQIDNGAPDADVKATLIATWARMMYSIDGAAKDARQVFQNYAGQCRDNARFWEAYLNFEIDLPGTNVDAKEVFTTACETQITEAEKTQLTKLFMESLLLKGGLKDIDEFMKLDRELRGR